MLANARSTPPANAMQFGPRLECARRASNNDAPGLVTPPSFAPQDHSGVLLDAEHAIEVSRVENAPEAINRSARGFRLHPENVIHSSNHEAERGVIAALDSFLDGRYPDRSQSRDSFVVRQVVGRRQIRPKDVLDITQRLLDYAVTLHAPRTLGKSHEFLAN
jgi:hypothetical protein